jgi:hypothetical protein
MEHLQQPMRLQRVMRHEGRQQMFYFSLPPAVAAAAAAARPAFLPPAPYVPPAEDDASDAASAGSDGELPTQGEDASGTRALSEKAQQRVQRVGRLLATRGIVSLSEALVAARGAHSPLWSVAAV